MSIHLPTLLIAVGLCLISCREVPSEPDGSVTIPSESLRLVAPDIISTGLYERDFAITPDGQKALFTRGNFDHTLRVIVEVERVEDHWEHPSIVSFSGRYNDIEPFFHPEASILFFASDRPLPGEADRGDYNIWKVSFADNSYSEPEPLDSIINTDADEFYPAVTRDHTLFFTATYKDKGTGTEDIYQSNWLEGRYGEPEALDSSINTNTYEFNAYINPAGDTLLFSSYGRPDGLGGGDLYISIKNEEHKWAPAINLGPEINSDRLDYCPFLDRQHRILYFTSSRKSPITGSQSSLVEFQQMATMPGNGMGDIYQVRF